MKLHRDLDITQKSAWFMAHRLREAFASKEGLFAGPVEVDETYFGGKRKNMSKTKRSVLVGRGPSGKTAVVGAKDRSTKLVKAKVIETTDSETLQGFTEGTTESKAKVCTDDARAYVGMARDHETVNHSTGEYVRGMAHANGIESFLEYAETGTQRNFPQDQPQAPPTLYK